jgi:hypothetical protein
MQVLSREGPVSLKIWPTGSNGERVGVMLSGTFHTHAGLPPAPLKPLRINLSATCVAARLEPDARGELGFTCCSTQPREHAAYNHTITLSNRHRCPLQFSFHVEGPFELTSATPSAPQDAALYRGTKGLSRGLPPPGQPLPPPTWQEGLTYLPPSDSVDVGVRFNPPPPSTQPVCGAIGGRE